MESIIIIHSLATCFMAGLCWFVQLVHYPLFHQIGLEKLPAYERKNFLTALITVPVMTVELASGLFILYYSMDYINFANVALMVIVGLSSFVFQVPIHLKLSQKATTSIIKKLISTNWIRTLTWSVRMVLICGLLSSYLEI